MGALIALNALMECLVTGLFTGLIIMGLVKIGWLPILFISTDEPPEDNED
jgi:hypothetical protein